MFVHLALVERLAPVDDLLLRELAFFALLLPVLILLDERDLALDDPGLAPEPVAEPVGTDPKLRVVFLVNNARFVKLSMSDG